MEGQSPRKSLSRRVSRALAFLGVPLLLALLGLPWLLALPPARKGVVAAVNRALAPSRVEVGGISAGWLRGVTLSGVRLTDRSGKTLIDARRVSLDRGLAVLAWNWRKLGQVTVEGAAVDIERRADGSIDLVDALVPPPTARVEPPAASTTPKDAGPGIDVTLRVVKSSLRLRTPELAEPILAGSAELDVHYPAAAGEKLACKLRLAAPPGGDDSQTLGLDATYDHHAASAPDLGLAVEARSWPLVLAGGTVGADLAAHVRLNGAFRASREAGRWSSTGDAVLLGLDAHGPTLAGDRLRLDRVNGIWDLAEGAEGWSFRRVELTCPVATLKGNGSLGASPSGRFEARVDLAALAKQTPRALRLRPGLALERGGIEATAEVSGDADRQHLVAAARLTDLVASDSGRRFALRDPAVLDIQASRGAAGAAVEALKFQSAFLKLNGSGDVEKGLAVNGTFDLAAIRSQFRDLIDFGDVDLAGQGRMAGDFRKKAGVQPPSYVARYAMEVKGLRVAGLTSEPIIRDLARVDASATGPAEASGLPRSWEAARLNVKSSRDALALSASRKEGGVTAVDATASFPWKLSERDGVVDARFVGRWAETPAAVDIDSLRLGLRPEDPALAAAGSIVVAVKGRLDLDGDALRLVPLPVEGGGAIAIAPEGLSWRGLRAFPTAGTAVKVRLLGDVARIDRALATWGASDSYGVAGTLNADLGIEPTEDGRLKVAVDVQVPDLSRAGPDGGPRRAEGPFRLAFEGHYGTEADRLEIDALAFATRWATLDAAGRLDEPTGRLVADLQGVLAPNWEAISAYLAEAVEPNLVVTGGPRPFRINGPLAAGSLAATLKGLDAELGIDLASADAFGLKLGPAPIVLTCNGGSVTIAPISTTLNGGQVELRPGLDVDEARGIALTLAEGSSIRDAQVNDEVSGRVLRYVAPILDRATQVNGRVSMAVERADIPLVGPDDRRLTLTGRLVFQDVVFAPGPFAGEILTLVGRPDSPGLRLSQPVQLSVADGRVIQQGLEIPIRRDVTVALEGSVGFDQSLNLRASVPVTRGMLGLGQVAQLDELVNGTRVTLPIGGTVQQPRIDRRGLQVALKDLSRGLINRGLSRGASELLDRLGPAPAAPSESPGAPATLEGAASEAVKGLEKEVLRRLIPGRRR